MENTQADKTYRNAPGAREKLLAGLEVDERRIRLNGIETSVLEGGDGPPIVLLHGPGENAAKWWPLIPGLAKTHRVIAPDLPGHGDARAPAEHLDAAGVLGWLDDLTLCCCPSPPTLVGQTLGGAIAARYAIDRPDRIRALVLVDALGLARFRPAPEFATALSGYVTAPSGETHDRLWERCVFDLDSMRRRIGERWQWMRSSNLELARRPDHQAALGRLMEQFAFPAIPAADLARIAVPVVLIWGRQDRATALPVAEAAAIRHAWPLHVIEDAGDDPGLEKPDAFLETLRVALLQIAAMDPPAVQASENAAEESRTGWSRIAPGYDRTNTPTQMWLANEGLRRAGLRQGMRFLDVAAGSGALSIPAARLGAHVVAIDQSPVMLDLLKARAAGEGLHVDTEVMDGHALRFPEGSFDLVGSQFGVMLFPDMPRAIREMARVARPDGGRVLLHSYGDPHRIEFLTLFITAVQSVRPEFNGPPADHPPLEFQLADPERLRAELAAAGLRRVTVETVLEPTEFERGEALWDWVVWSNPVAGAMLRGLDLESDEILVIKERLHAMVRERAGERGAATLTSPVHIGIGGR